MKVVRTFASEDAWMWTVDAGLGERQEESGGD